MGDEQRVPVIWSYNYDEIIGHAQLRDDGTLEVVITDNELIRRVLVDKEATVKAVSVYHKPAIPGV